ncbi:sulfite oxidase heme-binding subunit YedZ [Campylobacter sp. 2018MI35]|uniref:ferric reductase-like transmembrane domain-containing protein n=1 Tax=Campylobacter sp. 2018MI34 TaxID=2800582 RepID=UPI001908A549|nr:ferric reductase-like transmembrane domain-containing protein [Campylobacter sp. 2018MI34]MBK1992187.1 sulfite oxidase heme-binding subunit YedZ [Campylobacter sp. 2018MI34]
MLVYNFIIYTLFSISVIYGFYNILNSFDFVKETYFYTGIFSLIFLNLSLLFSLIRLKNTKDYPKLFGFFSVFWAIVHFLNYFIFDRNMQFLRLFDDISKRLLEASGFIAFVLLVLMFLSSFSFLKKIEKIRKLSYLCFLLASYHYFLSPKVPMFWEWSALIIALIYFILSFKRLLTNKLNKQKKF